MNEPAINIFFIISIKDKYNTWNIDAYGFFYHVLIPRSIFSFACKLGPVLVVRHSRPQRPRSFWSAPRITILGADQKERGLWGREW